MNFFGYDLLYGQDFIKHYPKSRYAVSDDVWEIRT